MLAAANAQINQQQNFVERLTHEYKIRIIELSKRDYHSVLLLVPGRRRVWEERDYDYHKICREDYDKSRKLIQEFDGYDFIDETERLEAMLKSYEFLALCYLKMPPEEFRRADWAELKDIINACEYRTHNSIAPESKALHDLFYYGSTKTMSKSERDAFEMYRLWKKWNTKPWEINGGIIYPEDIQTVLRIEEIQAAAEKLEREKEEARAKMKARASAASRG